MLHPPPQVDLSALQTFLTTMKQGDQGEGVLFTVNHYHAPDFQAWWIAILISATFPKHIHWVVTSGWTNSGWLTGFTHWLFPRGARLFGFTPMPAMPPDPAETQQRAAAVMHVLKYARQTHQPVIGMSPEGRDIPGGVLGSLPHGVGRFLHLLSHDCQNILPVGVWKESGITHLNFGCPYHFEVTPGLTAQERDSLVGKNVMQHIAQCLPERLRGEYQ